MPKLDERVRKLVAEELADVRNLFLDVDRDSSPSYQGPDHIGFGVEGIKPEVQRIEQMLSYLYGQALREEDEEDKDDDSPREVQKAKRLVAKILQTSADDDAAGENILTEVLDLLREWKPDIIINTPFSGTDAPDVADLGVTALIKTLPIDPRSKAIALLLFGLGGRMFRKYDDFMRDWTLATTVTDLSRLQKRLNDLALKVEEEVNSQRREQARDKQQLLQEIGKIEPPKALTNTSYSSNSMLQVVLADLDEIRRLL